MIQRGHRGARTGAAAPQAATASKSTPTGTSAPSRARSSRRASYGRNSAMASCRARASAADAG